MADHPRPELTYDDVIFNRGSIFASNGDLEDAAKSIINYILWDGRVVESEGAEPFLPEYEDGARYVIVLEPTTDIAAVYNSFLAFEIDHSEDNLADWAQFWELYRELTEDPVDLLTGSFSWEYQDFALYGRNDRSFIRYYESSDGEHNHALGNGWSHNYSYSLETGLLYAKVTLPGGHDVYFDLIYDGSYQAKAGSAYTLDRDSTGFHLSDRNGTVYDFSDNGLLERISYLDGNTISLSYNGDQLTRHLQRYWFLCALLQ